MEPNWKLQLRWMLGVVCALAIYYCLQERPYFNEEPNRLAALVWFVIGSVSYYSALRWLWRKLL